MRRNPPATPVLDAANRIVDTSHEIGAFLDWLDTKKIMLCTSVSPEGATRYTFLPIRQSFESLLAEYFDIDLDEMEREKRRLLEYVSDVGGEAERLRLTRPDPQAVGEEIGHE